jgi:hypothetical protein
MVEWHYALESASTRTMIILMALFMGQLCALTIIRIYPITILAQTRHQARHYEYVLVQVYENKNG